MQNAMDAMELLKRAVSLFRSGQDPTGLIERAVAILSYDDLDDLLGRRLKWLVQAILIPTPTGGLNKLAMMIDDIAVEDPDPNAKFEPAEVEMTEYRCLRLAKLLKAWSNRGNLEKDQVASYYARKHVAMGLWPEECYNLFPDGIAGAYRAGSLAALFQDKWLELSREGVNRALVDMVKNETHRRDIISATARG